MDTGKQWPRLSRGCVCGLWLEGSMKGLWLDSCQLHGDRGGRELSPAVESTSQSLPGGWGEGNTGWAWSSGLSPGPAPFPVLLGCSWDSPLNQFLAFPSTLPLFFVLNCYGLCLVSLFSLTAFVIAWLGDLGIRMDPLRREAVPVCPPPPFWGLTYRILGVELFSNTLSSRAVNWLSPTGAKGTTQWLSGPIWIPGAATPWMQINCTSSEFWENYFDWIHTFSSGEKVIVES